MKILTKLLKFLAPFIGVGGAYAALFTDVLAGLGFPVWLIKLIAILLGAGGVGTWVDWILKRFVTEKKRVAFVKKWGARWGAVCFMAGVATTLGASKIKGLSKLWNATLEPWLTLVVKSAWEIISYGPGEYIKGLESDNSSLKDD